MSTFIADGAAIAKLLRSEQGFVAAELLRKGQRVQARAKQLVGKDTHKLERSINKRLGHDGRGLYVYVGSTVPYSLLHHEGTRPHVIVPVKAQVLRFQTRGGIRFAAIVHHPGTRPNRYLVNALPAAQG